MNLEFWRMRNMRRVRMYLNAKETQQGCYNGSESTLHRARFSVKSRYVSILARAELVSENPIKELVHDKTCDRS